MRSLKSKLLLVYLPGVIGFFIFSGTAHALSGSEFQPGRIIDDALFYNGGTLDANTIQIFLNSKVPTCDTNGTQPYGGTTRAAYAASRGYSTPFTCLKDYSQDTPTKAAETGLCNQYNGGTKSAAQIIYDVGQACGVSQRAIIVLLEKEQSLITDSWPWSIQYRSATGYGCPDTAPCDAEYYGFFNQVYNAARQFKRYDRDSTLFRYRAYRDNYVQYHPNAACGGTNVYIQNRATAGLYNYTPYQPNAPALNNLYGTGDSCSAYGNRNFWRIYNDWFGGTLTSAYSAQPVWQGVFTDSSKTTLLGWGANLTTSSTAYVVLQMKNIGTTTWHKQNGTMQTMIGTSNGNDRTSLFCANNWNFPCKRPALMSQDSVAPGQIATFEFQINAPGATGVYNETFSVVVNGVGYLNGAATVPLNIEAPTNRAQPVWQGVFTDSSKTTLLGWGATLNRNQGAHAVIIMRNTGNTTWTRLNGGNDVMIGTVLGQDRLSPFCSSGWLYPCNRPVRMTESSVAPGQNATFEFPLTAPSAAGSYSESFGLVVNGKGYFPSGFAAIPLTVR